MKPNTIMTLAAGGMLGFIFGMKFERKIFIGVLEEAVEDIRKKNEEERRKKHDRLYSRHHA